MFRLQIQAHLRKMLKAQTFNRTAFLFIKIYWETAGL